MTKENWTDIHPNFSLSKARENWVMTYTPGSDAWKTYQQIWEEQNLTYQDAQEWIPLGFEPKDYKKVKNWKNHNLTPQETKSWIEVGLTPEEYNFASCLKQNNYQPHNLPKTIEELRNEHWLKESYPNKHQTKEITIYPVNLQGSLTISDYPQLEKQDISL